MYSQNQFYQNQWLSTLYPPHLSSLKSKGKYYLVTPPTTFEDSPFGSSKIMPHRRARTTVRISKSKRRRLPPWLPRHRRLLDYRVAAALAAAPPISPALPGIWRTPHWTWDRDRRFIVWTPPSLGSLPCTLRFFLAKWIPMVAYPRSDLGLRYSYEL